VRQFRPDPIEDTIISDAVGCAVHAPTAMNLQPWLIGVIRDKKTLSAIAALTDHGKFIAGSAVCFAIFGEKSAKYYLEDCSAATENLILALQAHGVGSCWVAGDKKGYAEPVRNLLEVPDNYTLVSLVPAGVPEDIFITPKKEIKKMVFYDTFKKD